MIGKIFGRIVLASIALFLVWMGLMMFYGGKANVEMHENCVKSTSYVMTAGGPEPIFVCAEPQVNACESIKGLVQEVSGFITLPDDNKTLSIIAGEN